MEHLTHQRKVTIMFAIIASMFFAAVNQTIVGPTMPRIVALLNGMDYYTWVISIYLLTSTIATILIGKLSDIYGRKPFILIGIVVFMAGAFLAGLSGNVFQLILYRGLQGIGGGIILAASFTAVGDLFSPRERGKWNGILMSAFGFSSIIGPALGGWIIDHMPWPWVFWIFLPIGIVAFLMMLFLFPKTERREKEPIDYAGSITLTMAIVTMLLAFTWAGTKYPWGSWQIVGLFAAAALFIITFVMIEKRTKSPVLAPDMFRNPVISLSHATVFLLHAGMMGALIYLPFFVQGVKGISATLTGYVMMPMTLGMVGFSTLSGKWTTQTGRYKRYALAGIPLMALGMLMMAFMDAIWLAAVSMFVFGAGLGLASPVFTLTVQNVMPDSELGVATASSQLFRQLGGTIGISIFGAVMALQAAAHMQAVDVSELENSMAAAGADIRQVEWQNPELLLDHPRLEQLRASLPEDRQPVFDETVTSLRKALGNALSTVFLAGFGVMSLCLLFVLFLEEVPLRTSSPVAAVKQPTVKEVVNR